MLSRAFGVRAMRAATTASATALRAGRASPLSASLSTLSGHKQSRARLASTTHASVAARNGLLVRRLTSGTAAGAAAGVGAKSGVAGGEKLFDKILIANRGEIAVRIMRTCKKLGIKTVAIYSTADANALHREYADESVCVGPPASQQSYLNVDAIVAACKQTGAQAVHPGYGFLSEKTYFADALEKAGVTFIGPPAKAIGAMGDKIASKTLARNAKVNIIPGFDLIKDEAEAVKAAREVGYPVMIKASSGGGGKGMRVAYNDEEARVGYRLSLAEAMSSFNSDKIFVEKYIEEPRHIEIQVLGDRFGNYLWLNERECSVQRRNQKVIEEAPSVFLDQATRRAMGEQACALARAVGYHSAGTVEMLVDKHRNFYFLEMNTRLQVEHPVTELITGVDLVEQMIRVAAGQRLAISQEQIGIKGWAVESRVYAEDPLREFLPSIGRLNRYVEPTGAAVGGLVRCDSGIREGAEISIYYDPMICKLVTHAPDRNAALQLMRDALDRYVIRGVTHNINFLRSLCDHPRFIAGKLTTNFIKEEYPTGYHGQTLTAADKTTLIASALLIHSRIIQTQLAISGRNATFNAEQTHAKELQDLVVSIGSEQYTTSLESLSAPTAAPQQIAVTLTQIADKKSPAPADGAAAAAAAAAAPSARLSAPVKVSVQSSYAKGDQVFEAVVNGERHIVQVVDAGDGSSVYTLQFRGTTFRVDVRSGVEHALTRHMLPKAVVDTSKFVVSPMPGAVYSVSVKAGDRVVAGQEVCVVEAMKMQNALKAQRSGTIKAVHVTKGKTVQADDVLIEFD